MHWPTVAGAVALEFLSCMGYVAVFQLVFARAPRRFAARLAWTEMAFGSALSFGGAGSLAIGAWVLKSRGVPADRIARRSDAAVHAHERDQHHRARRHRLLIALGVIAGTTNPLLTLPPAGISASVRILFLCIPGGRRACCKARRSRSAVLGKLLCRLRRQHRRTRHLLVTPDWRLLGGYVLPARRHLRAVRLPARRRPRTPLAR